MAKKNKSIEQNKSQETLTVSDVPPEAINPQHTTTVNEEKCYSEKSQCTAENKSPENNISSEPTVTVEELQVSLAAERDRVLRLSAEFDNYKKRSSREMADFRKFANESVFRQLLTVVDNLERALQSASPAFSNNPDLQKIDIAKETPVQDAQKSALIQGVEMTCKDIIKIFEAFSVKQVDAQGKPFDPLFHQAVSHQESEEHPDNTVMAELQKGYILHERLLRPSMVIVSKAASKKETIATQE